MVNKAQWTNESRRNSAWKWWTPTLQQHKRNWRTYIKWNQQMESGKLCEFTCAAKGGQFPGTESSCQGLAGGGNGGLVFKDYSSIWKRKHTGDELWRWLHQNQRQPDTSELHIRRELKGRIWCCRRCVCFLTMTTLNILCPTPLSSFVGSSNGEGSWPGCKGGLGLDRQNLGGGREKTNEGPGERLLGWGGWVWGRLAQMEWEVESGWGRRIAVHASHGFEWHVITSPHRKRFEPLRCHYQHQEDRPDWARESVVRIHMRT